MNNIEYMKELSYEFLDSNLHNCIIGSLIDNGEGRNLDTFPYNRLDPCPYYNSKFPHNKEEHKTDNQIFPNAYDQMDNTLGNESTCSPNQVHNSDVSCKKRTSMKIFNHRELHLPEGFPSGPWITFEDAKNNMQSWAYDFKFGGGRFSLILGSFKKANTVRGDQRRLICSRSKRNKTNSDTRKSSSDKCNCPYFIVIEECIEGWILFNGYFFHNHNLIQTTGSSLSQSSLRFIPDQLIEIGDVCERAGYSSALINRALQSEALYKGIEITWNYNDVYNHFKPTLKEKGLDATNFVECLHSRKFSKNLFCATITDMDGCLIRAFWIFENSMQIWRQGGDQNPLLFDTSHATNRYGLKFADMDTVDKHGRTVILACALIFDETEDSFIWIFEQFLRAFLIAPNTIITDGDPAIASAIKNTLVSTNHLLWDTDNS